MKKKILALLLTVLMVVSVVPMFFVGASAKEATLASDFSGGTSGNAKAAIVASDYKSISFQNWGSANWSKTITLDNDDGLITVEFDSQPNTFKSYELLTLNGVVVMQFTGDRMLKIGTGESYKVKDLYNQSTTVRHIKAVINPTTGMASVSYLNLGDPTSTDNKTVDNVNIGAVEDTLTVKIGATTGVKGWTALNFSVTQKIVTDPVFTCGDIDSCKPGDEITIPVSISNNVGNYHVTGLTLTPSFDTNTFELVSVTNKAGNILGDYTSAKNQVYCGGEGGNGEILEYKLSVKDTAVAGDYIFTVVCNEACYGPDGDGEYSDPLMVNAGTITVEALNGDINFEGYQYSNAVDGTYNIRFVSSGNLVDGMTAVGFEIKTTNLDTNYMWDVTTETVYKELSDEFSTAPTADSLSKDFVASLVLTGVPEDITDIDFTVKPYVIVNGVNQYGTEKTVEFEYKAPETIIYENNFDSSWNKDGATRVDGSAHIVDGMLKLENYDAATWSVTKDVAATGLITMTCDIYPNWNKVGSVLTINGTKIIGSCVNFKATFLGDDGTERKVTTNSKVPVIITIDPATGEGTIQFNQHENSDFANYSYDFEIDAFTSLTVQFGKQGNGWKVDNLLITQK